MKKFTKTLALGFASAVITTTAFAQLPPLPLNYLFDEFGGGLLYGTAPLGVSDPYPLPGSPYTDPYTGFTTLAYPVPAALIPGDILITEPGNPAYSDLLRIIQVQPGG